MTGIFDALLDDGDARLHASRDAALAYRAITGPPLDTARAPARVSAAERDDPPEAPLLAWLDAQVGGPSPAVDRGRATRLFWLHFAGERFFLDAWPHLGPVGPTDRVPGQGLVPGHWARVRPAAVLSLPPPEVQLHTRWPLSIAVLLATHLGLLPSLGGPPGRIVAAPEPEALCRRR